MSASSQRVEVRCACVDEVCVHASDRDKEYGIHVRTGGGEGLARQEGQEREASQSIPRATHDPLARFHPSVSIHR